MSENYKQAWEEYYGREMPQRPPSKVLASFIAFLKEQGVNFQTDTIIESFCGRGRNTTAMALEGMIVIGVDYVETAIRQAKQFAAKKEANTRFLVADLTQNWDFVDPSTVAAVVDFDGSVSLPQPDRTEAIKHAVDVLRPGGFYLLTSTTAAELVEMFPAGDGGYIHPKTGAYKIHLESSKLTREFEGLKLIKHENIFQGTDVVNGREIQYTKLIAYFQK